MESILTQLERNEATWRGRLDTAEAEIASLRRQLDAERASDERISTLEEENRTLKDELKKNKPRSIETRSVATVTETSILLLGTRSGGAMICIPTS